MYGNGSVFPTTTDTTDTFDFVGKLKVKVRCSLSIPSCFSFVVLLQGVTKTSPNAAVTAQASPSRRFPPVSTNGKNLVVDQITRNQRISARVCCRALLRKEMLSRFGDLSKLHMKNLLRYLKNLMLSTTAYVRFRCSTCCEWPRGCEVAANGRTYPGQSFETKLALFSPRA